MQWFFWIIGILFAAAAGFLVYRRDVARGIPYPWITALLRSLVILLAMALLLAPPVTITNHITEKPVVVVLQDNSTSVGVALGNDSAQYHKSINELTSKLADKYKVVTWGFGAGIHTDSVFNYYQQATDIGSALSAVQEYYGLQNLGAVVLATDGRFNQGINPLYQQLELHCPVYAVAIGDSAVQKDLRITKTYSNKSVILNSNFEIRADIVAELCKGYSNSALLKEGDKTVATAPLSINADKFDRSLSFTLKATEPGMHHYTMVLPDADSEQNKQNNRKDIFVEVADERKNILLVSDAPHPDINAIRDALGGMEIYSVSVCTADKLPASLNAYKVIVLHNLPSIRNNILPQLRSAGKPLWFIFTAHADITMYNAFRELTHNNFSATLAHDMPVACNKAFNAFNLPQGLQSIADKMPPLTSNAGNLTFPQNGFVMFNAKGQPDMPVWLVQQGNIPYAALMGEGIWRWRLYEFKNFGNHSNIDECIRQTIAFLAAGGNEKPFTVNLPKYIWSDQEAIDLNAYLLNANRELINTPDANVSILDSAGNKQDFSFERSGSSYHLNIGIHAGGTYRFEARTTIPEQGKNYTASGSFVVEHTPLEMMQQGADYPLLYSLAKHYNGAFFNYHQVGALFDSITHSEQIKPVIRTNIETAPLIDKKWYFFLLLLVVTGEWLLRKYWLAQ